MMTDAVQALDPVTPRPLEDGSLSEIKSRSVSEHRHSPVAPKTNSYEVCLQAFGSKVSDKGEGAHREEFQLKK